ncbi:hypothetical protein [Shewanella zhangzhouensis]|uniref:hypothetical protein n=1 Tax=Shewanella zhangzhouensis TaxID=2864213 RepID=UPI001C656D9D|nr:hypothetical protein [Shewanella zhangzhouensis]QYK05170.1 hypothetical protein K0H63_19350 [Shewanella zhangzhouensis]
MSPHFNLFSCRFLPWLLVTLWVGTPSTLFARQGVDEGASEYESLIKATQVAPEESVQGQSAGDTQLLNNQSLLRPRHQSRETALDSEGRPLAIPTEVKPVMEFGPESRDWQWDANRDKSVSTGKRSKASKTSSGKGRGKVANDPNCRWLDSRISQLEDLLASSGGGTHHQDELKARMGEWRCLKCGGDGPKQGDHSRCQYRR